MQLDGLKIIGTERHESRRIDNQLRGRSGRQGDIGESRFFISLEDDLMKIFGGDMITNVYNTLGADENMPIEHKIISNAVEKAQKRVESKHFSIRKNVLKFDDVMNKQREIIYKQRRQVLDGENLKSAIMNMISSVTEENLREETLASYEQKEKEIGEAELRELERIIMLKVVDQKWMDHIDAMEELKEGIGLRAYGQKDPVVQYRIEGFEMFDQMVNDIRQEVVRILLSAHKPGEIKREEAAQITKVALENLNSLDGVTGKRPVVNTTPKVGRNDPCTCGSGRKYKNCCGK